MVANCIYACRPTLGEFFQQRVNGFGFVRVLVVPRPEQLHENPLCPLVIIGVGGAYFPAPIVAKPNLFQLVDIGGNVGFCRDGGVLPRLNGVLFGGQPKRIETHRVQYIEPGQSLVASHNIRSNVPQWMPHV